MNLYAGWLLALTVILSTSANAETLRGRPGHHIKGEDLKKAQDGLVPGVDTPSTRFIQLSKDHFLTWLGKDNADSACAYYHTIGAITEDCDDVRVENGFFLTGRSTLIGLRFEAWQRAHNIYPLPPPGPGTRAFYFNAADLALGRSMHGNVFQQNGTTVVAY